MNKLLTIVALSSLPAIAMAQSAPDAYNFSQTDMRGTARFLSMGGAFTALGGDLSCLNQNPAGIGVYRRSEIGATLEIAPAKISSSTVSNNISKSNTYAYCNNFGYVGTVHLDGAMPTFSWGVSYNRIASFDRDYSVYNGSTETSLTNYIASFTNGVDNSKLEFDNVNSYNPYYDSNEDWLSILAYNSYLINPSGGANQYVGLANNSTNGDALTRVHERGYVDEYAIDFGGNVENCVYWGIGFGITDFSLNQRVEYSESMENATIYNGSTLINNGDAGFNLTNRRVVTGTGLNIKAGVIFKPIQEFRIGIAVHTPTWYDMKQSSYGEVDYSYFDPNMAEGRDNPFQGNEYTDDAYYDFRLKSPWKLMVGGACVIGNQAILSFDYERQAYNDMSLKYEDGWDSWVDNTWANDHIKEYYKASNIVRIGAEYRLTPSVSLRAGYAYSTTNVKEEVENGAIEVATAGTNPAYTLNKDTNQISAGLGYRYQAFYIDAAYVYRNRKSTYHAYTNFNGYRAPQADLTEINHSIVLSLGFKF